MCHINNSTCLCLVYTCRKGGLLNLSHSWSRSPSFVNNLCRRCAWITNPIQLKLIAAARGGHLVSQRHNTHNNTQCCTRATRTRQLSKRLSKHILRPNALPRSPWLVLDVPRAVSLVDNKHATQQGTLPMARCGLHVGGARCAGTGLTFSSLITSETFSLWACLDHATAQLALTRCIPCKF